MKKNIATISKSYVPQSTNLKCHRRIPTIWMKQVSISAFVEGQNVIVDGTVSTHYQAQCGCQEWVTSVDYICANGSSIPLLIIFTDMSIISDWIPRDFDTS